MDLLIVVRVALALDDELRGAALRDARIEPPHRVRLVFERDRRPASLVVSVAPRRPWFGRPALRAADARRVAHPFAGALRTLRGARVGGVTADSTDRRARIEFADGSVLLIEPVPHRANAVLLDPAGRVVASLRRSRSERARLEPGVAWVPAPTPPGRRSPFTADPEDLERSIRGADAEPAAALRDALLGLTAETAALVVEEAGSGAIGPLLRRRAAALACGESAPVIDCDARTPGEPAFVADGAVLWPWEPPSPPAPGRRRIARRSAAATVGLFHDVLDEAEARHARQRGLVALLDREIERTEHALGAARGDGRSFENPDLHRRHGEALLAGLRVARRVGDALAVPDPWSPAGPDILVPAPAGLSATAAAAEAFARHRRAARGIERAAVRRRRLQERLERYVAVREIHAPGEDDPAALESAMRDAGLPVGLATPTRRGGAASPAAPPRVEGVRLLAAADGTPILVGKTARDNQRLTFSIAGPEDFWFHVLGRAGAHVVVRNPGRTARPSEAALRDAAAAAAWYSEGRAEGATEVQWTRRKFVRRPRGAAAGTVVVKRSETVRVRPRPLTDET